MTTKVRDVMERKVTTVSPDWPLIDLERVLTRDRIGGAPVVEKDALVGVVSRTDVVRQLTLERSLAEYVSDWYYEPGWHEERVEAIAKLASSQLEAKRVRDVMIRTPWTIAPEAPVADAARAMIEHRIHRLPVTEDGRLVGIVTTMDLLPLIAKEPQA